MKIVSLLKNQIDFLMVTSDILAESNFTEKMYRLAPLARRYILAGDGFLRKMYRLPHILKKMYGLKIASPGS